MSHPTLTAPATAQPGPPLSLWSRIAPFDHKSRFLSRALWPLLSDEDVMAAMIANSATMTHLGHLTVRHAFKPSELLPQSKNTGRPRPRINRLVDAEVRTLGAGRNQLVDVHSLALTLERAPRRNWRSTWTVLLPPSLNELHLTVTARVWESLGRDSFPSALHRLSIEDRENQGFVRLFDGPLPPHVHTLTIATASWNWPSFQRLHLTADSTQLRSLTIGRSGGFGNMEDITLLPRSLTELDLCEYNFAQPLAAFKLPNLRTLRLAQEFSYRHRLRVTADSFTGLTALRELDLRHALSFDAALPPHVLPATLTSLSLPLNYQLPITAGALPH